MPLIMLGLPSKHLIESSGLFHSWADFVKKLESIVIDDWEKIVGLNTKEDIEWAESQKMI